MYLDSIILLFGFTEVRMDSILSIKFVFLSPDKFFSWHPKHKSVSAHHSSFISPSYFRKCTCRWNMNAEKKTWNSVDNLQEIFYVIDWLNHEKLRSVEKMMLTFLFTSPRCLKETKSRKPLSTITSENRIMFYLSFVSTTLVVAMSRSS